MALHGRDVHLFLHDYALAAATFRRRKKRRGIALFFLATIHEVSSLTNRNSSPSRIAYQLQILQSR